ncbi:hypothetical protein VTK26DRAFT_2309 [Humicola hyalothermophila]
MLNQTAVGQRDSARSTLAKIIKAERADGWQRNEKEKKWPVRLPSTPTPPERPKARPQGKSRGTDHRHSLYSRSTRPATATFAGRARVKKRNLTVGRRGYRSSTRVGSVAPLGNTREDNYYRNDSLEYCRHEEKKKKGKPKWREESGKYILGGRWPVRARRFAVAPLDSRRIFCRIWKKVDPKILPDNTARISQQPEHSKHLSTKQPPESSR